LDASFLEGEGSAAEKQGNDSMPRSSLGNKYNSHSYAKNKNLIKNKIEEHKLEKVDITTYYCHRVTSVGRLYVVEGIIRPVVSVLSLT
jgi:hypothetical protein